ncbi:MAG: putative porin [Bacteroidota bacterium]|nr:putative porin [Bacteroidota bacterium]
MKKYGLIISFLCSWTLLSAQHEGIERHFDTFQLNFIPQEINANIKKDTTLEIFHNVENYYQDNVFGGMRTGNNGHPFKAFDYFKQSQTPKFIFLQPLQKYTTQTNQITFFDTRKPFAKFQFISGPQDFEDVMAVFTANPSPFVNMGIKYRSIKSNGDFIHSESKVKDFNFWQSYTKKRYQNHLSFIHNKYSFQEFGGIVNDSAYRIDNQRIPNLEVNLKNAETTTTHQKLSFTQEYRLGKMQLDTIFTETDTAIQISHQGKFSIYQQISLERNSRIYSDIPSDFYEHIYRDSAITFDSISLNTLSHTAGLQYFHKKDSISNWRLFAGINNTFSKYHIVTGDELIENHSIKASIFSMNRTKTHYSLESEFGISGRTQGDINLNGKFAFLTDSTGNSGIFLNSTVSNQETNYFYETFASNHFKWDNQFNKTFTLRTELAFVMRNYHLKAYVNHALLNNSIYIAETGIPTQLNQTMNVANAGLSKTFYLGKFGLKGDVAFQYIDKSEIIKLPEFIAFTGVFYENLIFDNNMLLKLGIDARFFSDYESYTYIPATGFFAIQNQQINESVPLIDAFLSFKVKRFRAFLRYSNVGQSFLNLRGYSLLSYPNRVGGLHFGFSWEFYD